MLTKNDASLIAFAAIAILRTFQLSQFKEARIHFTSLAKEIGELNAIAACQLAGLSHYVDAGENVWGYEPECAEPNAPVLAIIIPENLVK